MKEFPGRPDGLRLRESASKTPKTCRLKESNLPVVVADHPCRPVGGVLARGVDGGVGALLVGLPDLLALLTEFRDPRLDLVGAIPEPFQVCLLLQDHARGFNIKEAHLDLVDPLQVVHLDLCFPLLHPDLLFQGLRVSRLNDPEPRIAI